MTQPQTTVPPGTYRLDPERSTVRATAKGMFGLITVHGTLRLQSGEVTVADDPTRSTVRATVDAGSYASGNAKRDADITSDNFLDAKNHPAITFEGNEVRQDGADWVVSGQVTVRGTSAPAEFRVHEAAMDGGAARFRVTANLQRGDFGMTKKKGMVAGAAKITIDAVGQPT